ncbi:MAG TPA: hypothetical protein VF495_27900, partial [Phenylobacterium sp.]
MAVVTALATLPIAGPVRAQSPDRAGLTASDERISDLVRVWYFARLFHPDLARRDEAWDAALVAAVPPARTAKDDAAFAAVVDEMLAKAGRSHAFAPFAAPAPPVAAPPFRLVQGAAVADCVGIADVIENQSLPDPDAAVASAIRQRGLVIDCRHFASRGAAAERRSFQFISTDAWVRDQIAAVAPRALPGGADRVRFHDGYPPPAQFILDDYQNGLSDVALAPVKGGGGAETRRITFLLDATTPLESLSPIAAAQAAAIARVVVEGDAAALERHPLSLRHVRADVLTARYVYPDGRVGFRPDACVPEGRGDEALARAIALLDPHVVSQGCAAPPTGPRDATGPAPAAPGGALEAGTRVLALAKLWGAIEYFYPYQAL